MLKNTTMNKALKPAIDTNNPPKKAPKPPKLNRRELFKLEASRKILSGNKVRCDAKPT